VATLGNLAVQRLAAAIWPWRFRDLAALAAGTGAGLAVKYLLDRRWIFGIRGGGAARNAREFIAYAGTGLVTTAVFWGVELGFLAAFRAEWARYAGGALGLAIGYALKYVLDRRFVFGPPMG
jgi:putative flippase GtrA